MDGVSLSTGGWLPRTHSFQPHMQRADPPRAPAPGLRPTRAQAPSAQPGVGGASLGISDPFASLQSQLDELFRTDPEQAERLAIVLRTLAQLNPKSIRAILGKIAGALSNFQSVASRISQSASETPSETTTPTQSAQGRADMIHFSLDFEITTSSDVTAVLADLRRDGIDVQAVRVQSTQTISVHVEFTGVRQQTQKSDPLVLDLAGNGVNLTGIDDGANFDINADGRLDRTAFVRGDDAFLAIDRNANGRIDNGTELFGDQNGALNGFEELAKYDQNGDRAIDARDAIFSSLRLLHDKNGDGKVDPSEISSLADVNIQSLSLNAGGRPVDDPHGNTLAQRASYARADGTRGLLLDVWVGYRESA